MSAADYQDLPITVEQYLKNELYPKLKRLCEGKFF